MKAVNLTLRRSVAAAVVALAVPALSSCSANFNAPTERVYTPGVGVNNRDGSIDVLHALVVSETEGSGTVVAALVNNDEEGDDALVEVTGAADDASLTVQIDGEIPIRAGGLFQLADEGSVTVTGDPIQAGRFVTLMFTFDGAESVTVEVPIVPRTGDFAGVPVPSEAGLPEESPAGSPSESAPES